MSSAPSTECGSIVTSSPLSAVSGKAPTVAPLSAHAQAPHANAHATANPLPLCILKFPTIPSGSIPRPTIVVTDPVLVFPVPNRVT